ncbi:hypothetical protein P389DRAFT_168422 [Cystobasidium minutum MCA 4210]|uniref:uncharacterized protein n=1 Tax=Cystobasidium minutum MCA 4210 TaxID=1397322 RepID=UPI0034CDE4B5|eukprot:jgi/Rhomi1/168422/fgenesh1_kg.2_\
MAQSRSCMPPRREHLISEYYGASEAAFAAMEQVEYFSSHARMAKARKDWKDEQDLWDAASRMMLSSIKHRDYELKCRKEEYRLYKDYMNDFDKKVQKSIMAYCKRRLHRLRTWEIDNLRLKASIVHLTRKIHTEEKKFAELTEMRKSILQEARLNGSRRAHVVSFGDGWEGRNGGRPQVHNEAFEIRQLNYALTRCRNWANEKSKEKDDATKTWERNRRASEAFRDEWRKRDDEARRLMMIHAAQRDGLPIPIFDDEEGKQDSSLLLSELGEQDAQDWEDDFDRACEEVAGAGTSTVLPHNLLSPTPTYEVANDQNDVASVMGETTFQYAGMKLHDGEGRDIALGGRQSGVDSGYESGINSGEGSSTFAGGPEHIGIEHRPSSTGGWDAPNEKVSIEATWKAAWDAVLPESQGNGHAGIEEWEYNYAQE